MKTAKLVCTLKANTDRVNSVAALPGKRIISASDDNTLKIWSLETAKELLAIEGESGCMFAVAVTPDGKKAIACLSNQTLKVWNLETLQEVFTEVILIG